MKKFTIKFFCLMVICLFTIKSFAQHPDCVTSDPPNFPNQIDIILENIKWEWDLTCSTPPKLCFDVMVRRGNDYDLTDPTDPSCSDYSSILPTNFQIIYDLMGVDPAAINWATGLEIAGEYPFNSSANTEIGDAEDYWLAPVNASSSAIYTDINDRGFGDFVINASWTKLATVKVEVLDMNAFMEGGKTIDIRCLSR